MPELQGIRVVVTRPKVQFEPFAKAIIKLGGQPIGFPVIKIAPIENFSELDQSLYNLASYDWLVFTSTNGVKIVWDRLLSIGLESLPKKLKVAAVGSKTAEELREVGITPNYIPKEYISDAIFSGMGNLKNKRVLLARAEIARENLPQMIREAGGQVDDLSVYRTIPAIPDQHAIEAIEEGVDVITFTSSSAVHNFAKLINSNNREPLKLTGNPAFAYIGPVTAQTAKNHNLPFNVIAETYTTKGLIDALVNYFIKQRIKI
ncbi:MAG: uroporphyrinogen-III synthase [Chloroflexi bacterium]|nr:uroporphyrinogen-III synthase [Chloroflexota bacterium]